MTRDFFTFNITESVLRDAIKRPEKFQWKLGYHFNGMRYKSRAGKYGRTISCGKLYDILGDPFIERYFETVYPYSTELKSEGDAFIYEAGQEIFPYLENVGFSKKEAEEIKARIKEHTDIFEAEMDKYVETEDKLRSKQEKYASAISDFYSEKDKFYDFEGQLSSIENDIYEIKDLVRFTRTGTPDKRLKVSHNYLSLLDRAESLRDILSDLSGMLEGKEENLNKKREEVEKLERKLKRIQGKINKAQKGINENQEAYNKALAHAREMLSTAKETFSSEIQEKGKRFAEEVREDIIYKLHSGSLPLLTHNVSLLTQKRRREAHLPPTPRFYASGQFINGVVVDIKLEKRQNE